MWDYIVLGKVPGTSIQISFDMWLKTMAIAAAAILLLVLLRFAYRAVKTSGNGSPASTPEVAAEGVIATQIELFN